MKTIILIILCSMVGCAQQGNTIYKTLFTNVAVNQTTPAVTNIGQFNHQVSVRLSNAPAHVCSPNTTVSGQLEFSYDQSVWTAFGTPIVGGSLVTTNNSFLWFGVGAFPFVRFLLSGFDAVNCRATGYYTGILGSGLSTQVRGMSGVGTTLSGASYPVMIGGVSGVSETTADTATPAPVCMDRFFLDVSPAATYNLTLTGLGGLKNTFICSVAINFSVNDGTIQFKQSADACATFTKTFTPVISLVKDTLFTLGSGIGPVFNIEPGNSLCAITTGGSVGLYGTLAVVTVH
jgi:hypothetical protein